MNWSKLTDEGLAEWRALPLSEGIRDALKRSHGLQVEMCKNAAWAGTPWPEHERLALRRMLVLIEDIFESDADAFRAMMEDDE